MPTRHSPNQKSIRRRREVDLPPRLSSGYLVRDAHRAFQRLLERRIAAYGVTRGQWYFLRVLWITDGLSQRELSARVGMMEPTTVIALRSMERAGLIQRVRSDDDRRKVEVFLTAKATQLRNELLVVAKGITDAAEDGITARDLDVFRRVITRMTANLDRIER
jgi:DNA-binding MarR family transcriptional regulator